jgi:hypothetical protein
MVLKEAEICDICNDRIAKDNCFICKKSLCSTCSSILVVDRKPDSVTFRFHRLTKEDEIFRDIKGKISSAISSAVKSTITSQHKQWVGTGTVTKTITPSITAGGSTMPNSFIPANSNGIWKEVITHEDIEDSPRFCSECVKRICETDATDEILKVIKEKIMVEDI